MALTDQKAAYMGSSLTTKSCDSLGKRKVLQKLQLTLGKHDCIVAVIRDILEHNFIRVSDGLMLFDTIMQTNWVLQGDLLSPLPFNLMMTNMKRTVSFRNMALLLSNHEDLQVAFDSVNAWAMVNSMTINGTQAKS
jgi:hypothetical protein